MSKFFSQPPPALQLNVNIDDPGNLILYLRSKAKDSSYQILHGNRFDHRTEVANIIWTLMIDETPIYAIVPNGPFAFEIHDNLVGFLLDQLPPPPPPKAPKAPQPPGLPAHHPAETIDQNLLYGEGEERISVPGVISGKVRLFTGEVVPVIVPDLRAMFSWRTDALAKAIGAVSGGDQDSQARLEELLNRIYFETRNLGVTSGNRALDYAVTNALQIKVPCRTSFKDRSSIIMSSTASRSSGALL